MRRKRLHIHLRHADGQMQDHNATLGIKNHGHVDIPCYCGDDAPDEGEIDADHRQDELEDAEWAKAKGNAVHDGAH